jgi:phosphoglycerate dehydrogenase-like enzyme
LLEAQAMKALVTDFDFPDLELEHGIFRDAGVELAAAQCRSEDELIAAARDCDALLLQYAPVTERVIAALPRVGIVSRYGAGFDTVDTAACARHGVWVANSPDYGVGEVATHALANGDVPAYVGRVGLEDLFEQADLVSLHVPLTNETRGMVGAGLLARMKRGSLLVNTARGAIVDVDALPQLLDDGTLDGVALDVLPSEPIAPEHALARHPRTLLTPHAAFYSVDAEIELRRKAALNIVQWGATGRPLYPVVQGTRRPGNC